jgi:hypothetical protein
MQDKLSRKPRGHGIWFLGIHSALHAFLNRLKTRIVPRGTQRGKGRIPTEIMARNPFAAANASC